MTKLKKFLSVLLTLVMLFTTLCFFPIDLALTKAEAAVSGIKIVVPETIYLTPSSGASTTGQYYVNNNSDGSVKTAYDTSASVAVTYPGAKLESVSASNADIGAISGLNGTTLGSGAATASGAITLNSGLNAGSTALVEWIFVFTVNGKTQTHYAYSVAYAPWYQPVGAASKAVGSWHNTYASSILWVSGVHGYSDGSRANSWYVQTANFLPMLGTIKAPSNNNPETNWIQSGSNGLSPTMAYNSITESGTNYHARANTISPTANITVDISRYSNFNQIPNFKVGFMVTDKDGIKNGTNAWYVSDYGTSSGSSYYNGTARGSSQYTGDWNDKGTVIWENGSDTSAGIKVNQQSWNKAISGTASFRLKSAVRSEYKATITSTGWNNNFVNISVTGANKSTLRTAVMAGASYAKENYTSATWNEYYAELKSAAANLGNPTSSSVDTSALTAKEAALQTTAYFDANGGTLGCAPSVDFVIGGNATASFSQDILISAYPASRTGYTFKGWSTDKNATSVPETLTVGFNQTVYAVWEANKYTVVFDNLIDFDAWKKLSPSNAVVSDMTDNGFTLTTNSDAGEGTFSSPFFPVEPGKSYTIDADISDGAWDIYIFFCNESGAWIDFADGPTNRFSNSTDWGNTFTAPDKAEVVKAQIRVDSNGASNSMRFENIRVYEDGTVADGVSWEAPVAVTYDSAYGSLPVPTRYGYEFKGWVDENGNAVSSASTVDFTETKHLYSTWEIGTYTITFDTAGGSAVNPVTGSYGTAVTAPAAPSKTGYTFIGWDKTVPDTIPGENITITAKWKINQYTVTFDSNGGTAVDAITQDYGTDITAPAAPTREGYTFAGWENLPATMPAENVTVTAKWTVNQYTITFDSNGGTAVDAITQDYGTAVTAPTAPTKEGYTFAGWDKDIPASMPAENITITAKWTVNQYTITFDSNGGTAVDAITQDYGTAVTAPTAPTKEGYTFAGWENLPATMPAGNITVKAIWEVNSYTVEYNANSGEGSVDSQLFSYEDTVTLRENAFVKEGYHFIGWALTADGEVEYSGGQSGIAALTAEADGVVTLYAVWEKNDYTVTFDKNDAAATGTMSAQGFIYDETKALAELGFTKEGYHFVEWNTSADGNGTAYGDMAEVLNLTAENNGNVTLYAIWTINLYDVTFRFFDADGDEVTVTRTDVPHGTDFSSLVPDAGEGVAEIYYNKAADKNAPHYVFSNSWTNEVDEITEDAEFAAEYTEEAHVYYSVLGKDKPATCTEEGLLAEYCNICNYQYEEVLPKKDHSWYETGRTATCTDAGYINYKCRNCNGTKQEVLAALGHTAEGGRWETTTPAGCITEGEEAHYCGRCNTVYETRAVTASGHTFTDISYKAPDCVNTGNEAYRYCSVCELYFAADADAFSAEGKATNEEFIIPADGHRTVLVDAVAPECEKDGNIAYYTCENCELLFSDAEATVIISLADTVDPMKGHDYEATVTPPTCTEQGYTTYVCKNDSTHTYVDNYETALGHKAGDTVTENDKPASCTENGSYDEVVYCTVCKTQLSRVTKTHTATGHTPAKKQETITEATCTVPGDYYDITYCIICDEELDRVEVTGQTLPHTYTEQLTDEAHLKSEATCNTYAVYYYDCIYCSANAKDEADKDNYTFSYTAGGYDADNHTGTTTTADEDIVPGTCKTEKTWNEVTRCDDCGEIITSVPKKGEKDENNHTGETEIRKEDVVAGTCTSPEMWNDVTYCLDCDKAINTEARTGDYNPSAHSTTERVLKDDKAATCCEDGFTGNMYCADCDEIVTYGTTVPATKDNHTGGVRTEKEDVVPGTCMSEEVWNDVTYCVGCGDKLSSVPATGEKNPQNHTGNNTVTVTNKKAATCAEPETWTEITVCECGVTVKTENKTGTTDPDAHTGEAYTEKINVTAGDCMHEETYTEVTYCKGCNEELDREDKTGEKDPDTHTGITEIKAENIVPGTCKTERSWDEVTYCECGEKLGSVHKTGEKDEDNHEGTPTKLVGYKAPTCKLEGYSGDKHYTCCDELYEKGTAIATTAHTPGDAVTENDVPPTENEDGHYDSVIYCTVCHEEIFRDTIIVRPEREITFVLYGNTVVVKAYLGDTLTAPEVPSYTSIDGFVHQFKSWDKPLAVVSGSATYTAVYTEPCDYTDLDTLYDTLTEVLEGDFADDSVLEANKTQIEQVLKAIEEINKDRNTRDSSQQESVDVVADSVRGIIDIIYPDAGSTLVITGAAVQYTGGVLDIKAVKMPVGTTVTDVVWTSSDEDIVFISNGKLYAVGTGTVTITASRGILKAVKTVSIVTGGDVRGINFTSVDNTKFIIEDAYKVKSSAIIYWTDAQALRFTLTGTTNSILYERYAVYLNGLEILPNADGYYVIPAGSGDAQITVAIIMKDDGEGTGGEITTKWSFWEWILSFFRRIAEFFRNIGK